MNTMENILWIALSLLTVLVVCNADGQCEDEPGRNERYETALDIIVEQREARKCAEERLQECLEERRILACDDLLILARPFHVNIVTSSAHPHCVNVQNYRINATDTGTSSGNAGAWCAGSLDQNQFIEAQLTELHQIRGVITQGRQGNNQWVTQYSVSYSSDCEEYHDVGKVYGGNWDTDTAVTNLFDQPVRARCVRINPLKYNNYMSMRVDIIGC